jgi:protein-tyrosine kinase
VIVRCRRCDTYFHVDDAALGAAGDGPPKALRCAKCGEPVAVRRRRRRAAAAAATAGAALSAARDGNGNGRTKAAQVGVLVAPAPGPGVRLDPTEIDPALAAVLAPSSPEADLFKRLRARLLLAGAAPRTVLVTSALPGEGKTVVAVNLAASIASAIDRHALLIDANPRGPRAAKGFGLAPARGLLDWLAAPAADLASYILRLPVGNLSLLPLGEPVPHAPELLASGRMRDLLREVGERYDDRTVIVDGPSLGAPEALALASRVDGVLLVVRANRTPRAEVERARAALAGARLLGMVLNQVADEEA